MTTLDLPTLNQWLGKTAEQTAPITADTANLMNATLNRPPTFSDGDELPPAWHWLYFHEPTLASRLGVEGHAALGQFMPPVSFGNGLPPRRMWAGGKISFGPPVRLGDLATKRSTIQAITPKEGRSGKLCFVIVEHEVSVGGERKILEEQTIVYREPADGSETTLGPPRAPQAGAFSATYTPDPIMLFRYSALTFNGHRIHYDADFCREHEGYPDLVVHGPLIATLILDLFYHEAQRQAKHISDFSYRARSPLFNPKPFTVSGNLDGSGWAANHRGELAMRADVTLV